MPTKMFSCSLESLASALLRIICELGSNQQIPAFPQLQQRDQQWSRFFLPA
jgi:hypothetical protein